MKFLDNVKKYGNKLVEIFFWPFTTIIEILYFVVNFVNSCGKSIVKLKNILISLIQSSIKNIEEGICKRKRWQNFLVLLGKITTTNIELMHGYLLGGITGILVILLQTISFFTTYGGTSYYFSGIGTWVPVAFAFVVQCTIVTFSLRSSDKTRHKIPQKTVLSIAVVISILFSYVGTINSAIEPYEEFSQDYKSFSESFYVLKEKALSNESIALSKDDAVQLLINQVDESQTLLVNVKLLASGDTTEDSLASLLSGGKTESGIDINIDPDTKDLIESAMKNKDVKEQLNKGVQELEDVLNSNNGHLKTIFTESHIASIVKNGTTKEMDDFFTQYNILYSKTQAIHNHLVRTIGEAYTIPKSFKKIEKSTLVEKMENYTDIFNLDLEKFEYFSSNIDETQKSINVTGVLKTVLESINKNLLKTSDIETYSTIVHKVQGEAHDIYKSISIFVKNIPDLQTEYDEFNKQYETINNAKDATIVAFKRLFDKKTFNRAIVPAILAILVDGGTILIAWAGQRKKYSYLYANTNRDYFEEEIDLFEQVFIATNDGSGFQDIINKNLDKSDEEFIQICHNAIIATIKTSNDYLKLFSPSPWTVNLGCGLYVKSETLNSNTTYNALTSLLLNFGYLIELSCDEVKILKQHYYDSSSIVLDETGSYYFLRFRVENYLRQSMSNVSIYTQYLLKK